jgi:hypothetical protein
MWPKRKMSVKATHMKTKLVMKQFEVITRITRITAVRERARQSVVSNAKLNHISKSRFCRAKENVPSRPSSFSMNLRSVR